MDATLVDVEGDELSNVPYERQSELFSPDKYAEEREIHVCR